MKIYPLLSGFAVAGILANASLTLANPAPIANDNPNNIRPLPTPTGNSRDLQGLTSPKPNPRSSVQPRSNQSIQREYQIGPNQRSIDPETGIIEWKDQGEPRSGSGEVPLLNF